MAKKQKPLEIVVIGQPSEEVIRRGIRMVLGWKKEAPAETSKAKEASK